MTKINQCYIAVDRENIKYATDVMYRTNEASNRKAVIAKNGKDCSTCYLLYTSVVGYFH